MNVCPACARIYDASTTVCREDGVFLRAAKDPRTGLRVGSYLLMGPLGKGGMGQVYRGEHVVIKKPVAIKVLHPELAREKQVVDRFLMEARAISMIRHNNIVDVTDFGELPDGCSFFVMEFLEGSSLAKVIDGTDRLPLYRAVNILTQVCHALHACHEKRIAHRDLKPENILLIPRRDRRDLVTVPRDPSNGLQVRPEGTYDEVKILDFGIAKIQQMTARLDLETKSKGLVFGSPYYLSPEQAQGEPGDHRSDIYAMGIIFYEMLTGEVPFDGDTPHEVLGKQVSEPVPSMRSQWPELKLPPEADQLVAQAAAKAPADRYGSAMAFLTDLRKCFGNVIYGRDINKFLKVQRRRTQTRWRQPLTKGPQQSDLKEALERRLTPRRVKINAELQGLFNQAYEQPKPVTETTLAQLDKNRSRGQSRQDSAAVRAELEGLFHSEED